MKKDRTVLVAIDLQERLIPAMKDGERTVNNAATLAEGCGVLGVPLLITQQYTKGLGKTVEKFAEKAAAGGQLTFVEKTSFSAMGEPEFVRVLGETGRKTVLLIGVEAHVCVQQTCIDMLEAGYEVVVVADCVDSRKKHDKKHAINRMERAGATVTTYESALFELLGGAKEEGFKQISALVK